MATFGYPRGVSSEAGAPLNQLSDASPGCPPRERKRSRRSLSGILATHLRFHVGQQAPSEADFRCRPGLKVIQIRAGRFKWRYSGPKSPAAARRFQSLTVSTPPRNSIDLVRRRPCSVRLTVTMAMPRASPICVWLRGAAQEFPSAMPLARPVEQFAEQMRKPGSGVSPTVTGDRLAEDCGIDQHFPPRIQARDAAQTP